MKDAEFISKAYICLLVYLYIFDHLERMVEGLRETNIFRDDRREGYVFRLRKTSGQGPRRVIDKDQYGPYE